MNIKEIRKQLGLSRRELAIRIGITDTEIRNYENGNRIITRELKKKLLQLV